MNSFRVIILEEIILLAIVVTKVLDAKCLIIKHNRFQRKVVETKRSLRVTIIVLHDSFFESVGVFL